MVRAALMVSGSFCVALGGFVPHQARVEKMRREHGEQHHQAEIQRRRPGYYPRHVNFAAYNSTPMAIIFSHGTIMLALKIIMAM